MALYRFGNFGDRRRRKASTEVGWEQIVNSPKAGAPEMTLSHSHPHRSRLRRLLPSIPAMSRPESVTSLRIPSCHQWHNRAVWRPLLTPDGVPQGRGEVFSSDLNHHLVAHRTHFFVRGSARHPTIAPIHGGNLVPNSRTSGLREVHHLRDYIKR